MVEFEITGVKEQGGSKQVVVSSKFFSTEIFGFEIDATDDYILKRLKKIFRDREAKIKRQKPSKLLNTKHDTK